MTVGEEVVTEQRSVDQDLDNAAHEAGVAKVDQTSQSCRGVLTEAQPVISHLSIHNDGMKFYLRVFSVSSSSSLELGVQVTYLVPSPSSLQCC